MIGALGALRARRVLLLHVGLQRSLLSEGVGALRALERFLARVGAHVERHVAGLAGHVAANSAEQPRDRLAVLAALPNATARAPLTDRLPIINKK